MHLFKDRNDKTWEIDITSADLRPVRENTGVAISHLTANRFKGLSDLFADLEKFVDVLYVLCKRQCDTLNMSDSDFGRSFDGDALERASDAFMGALIDFFPKPDVRKQLKKMLEKGKDVGNKTLNLAMLQADQELEAIDTDDLAKKFLAKLTQSSSTNVSNGSATKLPGSAA